MANTFKVLSRAAATTSASTVYTVPSSTKTLVTNIVINNQSTSAATYTIYLNNVPIALLAAIPARDSVIIDAKQVLEQNETISTLASTTSVSFHISGLEIN
jgi:outer membrane protein W